MTKPNEKQQFSLGTQEKPKRDNAPKVDKKVAVESRKAKVISPKLAEYLKQLETEKRESRGGWSDYNDAFFSQFRKQGE